MTELLSILYELRIFTLDELSEALKDKVKSRKRCLLDTSNKGWIVARGKAQYLFRDNLEKVMRLVEISTISMSLLSKSLVLKGGTAINLTIFRRFVLATLPVHRRSEHF